MAIKLIDRDARFEIVSVNDDAIIHETEEEIKALAGAERRIDKYQDSLSLSDLKLDPSKSPTLFVVRALTHKERSEMIEQFTGVDPESKIVRVTDVDGYFSKAVELGLLGIKKGDELIKVSAEDLQSSDAAAIGAMIINLTVAGKNLKNV